jgi:hypothetical protein
MGNAHDTFNRAEMTQEEIPERDIDLIKYLCKTLAGAEHALRSFQYGNASEEFAEAQADICADALAAIKSKGIS